MFLLVSLISLVSVAIALDADHLNTCSFRFSGWNIAFSRCRYQARLSSITTNLMNGVYLLHEKNNGDGLQLQSSIQSSPMCEGEAAKQLPKCNPQLQPGYEIHMYAAFWFGRAIAVSGYANKKGTNESVHFSASPSALWVNNERKTDESGSVTVGGTKVEWSLFGSTQANRFQIVLITHATNNYQERDAPWSNEKTNSHENVRFQVWVLMYYYKWYFFDNFDQGEYITEGLCGTSKALALYKNDDAGFSFPTSGDSDKNTCPCERNFVEERMIKVLTEKKEPTTDNFHLYDKLSSYWLAEIAANNVLLLIACHNALMLETNIVTVDDNVCPNTELTNEASSGLASMWNIVPDHKQSCIDFRANGLIDAVIYHHAESNGNNQILHSPLEVQSYEIAMQARMVKCSLAAMCLDQNIAISDAESIWIEYCEDGVFSTELELESNLNRDHQQGFQAIVESAFDIGFTACTPLGDLIQIHREATSTMAPTTTTTSKPTTTTTTTMTTASPGGRVRRRLLGTSTSDNDISVSSSEYKIQYNSLKEFASIRRNCVSIQPEPSDWITATEISVAIQNCVIHYDFESPQDSLFFIHDLFQLADERRALSQKNENVKANYMWFYTAGIIMALCAAGCVVLIFIWRDITSLRREHQMQVALISGKDSAKSADF